MGTNKWMSMNDAIIEYHYPRNSIMDYLVNEGWDVVNLNSTINAVWVAMANFIGVLNA